MYVCVGKREMLEFWGRKLRETQS